MYGHPFVQLRADYLHSKPDRLQTIARAFAAVVDVFLPTGSMLQPCLELPGDVSITSVGSNSLAFIR
jgi:hypothetical protein